MSDLRGDGNVLYLGCTNVNTLVVLSFYGFARHCHWGILGKGTQDYSTECY